MIKYWLLIYKLYLHSWCSAVIRLPLFQPLIWAHTMLLLAQSSKSGCQMRLWLLHIKTIQRYEHFFIYLRFSPFADHNWHANSDNQCVTSVDARDKKHYQRDASDRRQTNCRFFWKHMRICARWWCMRLCHGQLV